MRRVVVTGMGIVSSIGNSAQEVTASLREARSGITRAEKYAELGFKCQVHGAPHIDWAAAVPRKPKRFMEEGLGWSYIAMDQAIRDAGLRAQGYRQPAYRHHRRIGRAIDARHRQRGGCDAR